MTLHAVYRETMNNDGKPADVAAALEKHEGYDVAAALLASLVNLYAWDGRISSRAKEWAATVSTALDEDTARRVGVYTDIHRAHLDQIVRAFIGLERPAPAPAKEAAPAPTVKREKTNIPPRNAAPQKVGSAPAEKANATAPARPTFDELKRTFEAAAAAFTPAHRATIEEYELHHNAALEARKNGLDYTTDRAAALALRPAVKAAKALEDTLAEAALALATADASSVINKLVDPQRKTAATLYADALAKVYADEKGFSHTANTSHSGQSAVMLSLKRGIYHDINLLKETRDAINAATRATFNKAGDLVIIPDDENAAAAVGKLIGEKLTDGMDLVQEAAAALLEAAKEHAGEAPGWLDNTYTALKLKKSVLRPGEKREYVERETTPSQEVYRAVRSYVQKSRAVQTDPKNGYIYIEDMGEVDGENALERVYRRMNKYADIGGYACIDTCPIPGAPAGYSHGSGLASGDIETLEHMEEIVHELQMRPGEQSIVRRRICGYSVAAIAEALNMHEGNVCLTMRRIQDKWIAAGYRAPRGWSEESRAAAKDAPRAVEQLDMNGNVVATYDSISAAAVASGIDKANISRAAHSTIDAPRTAGGYFWRFAPVAAPVQV